MLQPNGIRFHCHDPLDRKIFGSHGIFRTTNACESFQAKFREICISPHPNIYAFIETLKNI
jgi:hypothetical protein